MENSEQQSGSRMSRRMHLQKVFVASLATLCASIAIGLVVQQKVQSRGGLVLKTPQFQQEEFRNNVPSPLHDYLRKEESEDSLIVLQSTHEQEDGSPKNAAKKRLLQSAEFDTCLSVIQEVASSGNSISFAAFLKFLQLRSDGRIDTSDFNKLPVDLISIFYFVACYNGGCTSGGIPSISVDTSKGLSLLFDLCKLSNEYTEAQSLHIRRFSYVISHDLGLDAAQIMSGANGNTIKQDLERATENVILKAFGCVEKTVTRRKLTIGHYETYPPPAEVDYIERLLQLSQIYHGCDGGKGTAISSSDTEMSIRELQDACPYEVEASVDKMSDYECTVPSDDISCILVTSSLVVKTGEGLSRGELRELRATVVRAISDGLDDGTFTQALQKN